MASNTGCIQMILGPMFCGKSTELIRRVRRHVVAKQRCFVIKYINDTRYDAHQQMSTHDRIMWDAIPSATLETVRELAMAHDVIGIDEGQFFPDVVEFCDAMASAGKTVIVAALDGDYRRQPFGRILNLIPLADEVIKLKAVCTRCQGDAPFSFRILQSDCVELIGGAETYTALCRECYHAATAVYE